ncbi:MAG TPA: serine protease [Rhizomicrobium sp.]|nr:serine protease [Rhizomicrobium sp.]
MTKYLMTGVLAWMLACGAATAQTAEDSSTGRDPSATQNSVRLARVILALPAGSAWLTFRTGLLCIANTRSQTWAGGREAQNLPPYAAPFKAELERTGYKVITPGEDNIFEPDAGSVDYEIAAVITDADIEGCVSQGEFFTDRGSVRGSGSMKIDWQLYSRIKKQVVAHVGTSGTAKLDRSVPGGAARLIVEAFASNVRELAQNADFRAAMNAPKAFTAGFQMPGQQSKIFLAGSLKTGPRKISDAVGSVVTILSGSGSGSGFLVSTDGYVLTDAHVVGDDKQVRVRWSDGLEGLATVERVSKNRDVAILKTNARDRTPLAIRRGPVTPGERVYAIGSPAGQKFEGTVSSGIISADRVFDGLRYVQSDTVVSHGSSGGPLLDEKGAVIGLTDLGIQNDGPAGLNLFTPIGDAMDFLSLEQR